MEVARGEQASGMAPCSSSRSNSRRPEAEISHQTSRPRGYLLVIRSRGLVRPRDTSAYRSKHENGRSWYRNSVREIANLSSGRVPTNNFHGVLENSKLKLTLPLFDRSVLSGTYYVLRLSRKTRIRCALNNEKSAYGVSPTPQCLTAYVKGAFRSIS